MLVTVEYKGKTLQPTKIEKTIRGLYLLFQTGDSFVRVSLKPKGQNKTLVRIQDSNRKVPSRVFVNGIEVKRRSTSKVIPCTFDSTISPLPTKKRAGSLQKPVRTKKPVKKRPLEVFVSIVIVTHNRKETLRKTLTALSIQCKVGDEIIVVDDGSTDGTEEMVKTHFPQARYIRMKHEGYRLATMKNRGIFETIRPFIICLDDDCVPQTGFIEAYRENTAEGKLLLGGIDFLDQTGKIARSRKEIPLLKGGLEGGYGGNICFYKFDAVTVGLFDEEYNGFWGYEDTDFIVKMRESGVKLEPVFSARVQHQWHPVDDKVVEEGKERNAKLLKRKLEKYTQGFFPNMLTMLVIVDQYDWAWDIAARELLDCLKCKGLIVSTHDFIRSKIDPSQFGIVLAWYWIMLDKQRMVADPRILHRLNPENTILCVAGEHIFPEGFSMEPAKNFRFIGANNRTIFNMLKAQAPDKTIHILSHGVDLEKFQPKPPSNEPSETFTVGWVGSTRRKLKRYALAVEAVNTMANVKLKVAGHVSTKYTTKQFISPEAMPEFYHSIDCLLVTSETESHPLVVYEAMASGIPVVSTAVGDVSETIIDGYNGLLLPIACTVQKIKQAVGRLRESPAFARALAVNARKTVEEKWNWTLISEEYNRFFEILKCKFTVSMLVSRDDELLKRAVASVVKQKPAEFRAYIDPVALKDYGTAEKILKDAGAKVYLQHCNPENTSYLLHTCDVARSVHRAIREAENKWVCWIDDDDEMFGDRRKLLTHYGSEDVGLIHGDVVRAWPYTARLKTTKPMNQPRDAIRCVGSGTIYNRDAFKQVETHIQEYLKNRLESAAYWDYVIAYWIKRAGWKTVYAPTVLSIQNVNEDHPPERKKLYDLWAKIADELDKISV